MNEQGPIHTPDPVVAALAEAEAEWAVVGAAAADSKLGTATLVLDVGDALAVTGHFVITNGSNSRQVRAIANEVEHQLKIAGGPSPIRIEGLESLDWVLIDYGDFVVHVFSEEARGYYQLERLWKDCEQIDWRGMVPAELQHAISGGAAAADDAAPADDGFGTSTRAPAVSSGDFGEPDADPVVERATW